MKVTYRPLVRETFRDRWDRLMRRGRYSVSDGQVRVVKRCGRIDDHEDHYWVSPITSKEYRCDGHVVIAGGERIEVRRGR